LRRLSAVLLFAVSLACFGQEREVSSLLDALDAYLEWNPLREVGVILVDKDRVAFKIGVPVALINYS
jgi:hypothetical protein